MIVPCRSWLASALVLALLVPSAAQARTHRYALVVGQNEGGPGTDMLYFAEADAAKVARVLVELGGFPAANVAVVQGVGRAGLLRELDRMADRVAGAPLEPGDDVLLLFFYSGHGNPDGLELDRTVLGFEELDAWLESAGADVRLVLVDSCHSGALTRAKGATKGATKAPSFLLELGDGGAAQGKVVLSSSAADELSQESDEIGGSYFTHFLVSGLRGAADEDADGRVSLHELYAYLYQETTYRTAGTRTGVQHPTYDYDLTGTGDLVLTDTQPRGGALVLGDGQPGRYLVFDEARRAFVAEVHVAEGQTRRLALDAGTYRVQLRGAVSLFETVVEVPVGGEAAPDVDGMAEVSYSDDVTKGAVLQAKRRTHGPRLQIGVRLGYQVFLDQTSRDQLFPPVPVFGLQIGVDRLAGVRGLRLFADAAVGGRDDDIDYGYEIIPLTFREVGFGLGATYGLDLRHFRLYGGLRMGGLYAYRAFRDPVNEPAQDLFTFLPGAVVGVGVRFDRVVGLLIEARINYLYYDVGDDDMSVGNVEVSSLVDFTF